MTHPESADGVSGSPLTMSFDVDCSVEHAFSIWTQRIGSWWPRDHTVTGTHGTEVVLQPHEGGRIYERAAGGAEHVWGHVTVWEPPHRLSYLWHLGRDAADATEVDVTFASRGQSGTSVRIEHHGWDRLGATGGIWRERNKAGWDSLLPHYLAALRAGGT